MHMSFQKKPVQNDPPEENLTYSISSYSISTNNNLTSTKKNLTKDDPSSSRKCISMIYDGFYEMKKKIDKVLFSYPKIIKKIISGNISGFEKKHTIRY